MLYDIHTLLKEKKAAVKAIQDEIQILEQAMRMFPNDAQPALMDPAPSTINMTQLRAQRTQKEALSYIADQSNGYVKANDAKALLRKAGFCKGKPAYIYGHLYALLKGDDRYEQLGDGIFRKFDNDIAANEEVPASPPPGPFQDG